MLLEIQSLTHKYKDGKSHKTAINALSLEIKPGILGLLGPNGAGKSSLMRILATITKPSCGKVQWNGVDIVKKPQLLRDELGYLPQYFGVYEQLSAVEFLQYMASLKGIDRKIADSRIDTLLQRLNLSHVARQPLSGYSGGMKQRIGIAQALLNDPKLLIIDEPTVGLDPQERNNFRQLLTEISSDKCIIFSTHIVSDVESIADHIAIMQSGKLIQSGTPEILQQTVADKCWTLQAQPNQLKQIQQDFIVSHSVRKGELVELNIVADSSPEQSAETRMPTLEDSYLYHTSSSVLPAVV